MGLAQVPGLTSSLAYKAWFLLFVCLFILLKWLVCKFHSLNSRGEDGRRENNVYLASRRDCFDLQYPVTLNRTDFPQELVNGLCDSPHRGLLKVAVAMPLE